MRKQTYMIALLAAILIAVTSLLSGAKLESAAPYINIAGLTPALAAPLEPVGPGATAGIAVVESEVAGPGSANEGLLTDVANAIPFTATTGLDEFSSYRMDYVVSFDGTRQLQPASGSAQGTLEATNDPDAQHLQATLKGNTFSQLGLPATAEAYLVNDTVYFEDPRNGAWVGVPERMVSRFLPDGIPSPEDYIELPVTAVRQPGWRTINGVLTRRYTFGLDDMADGHNYQDAEGTIWVAVRGDYVVRYEATLTGQHENLAAGGVELMDDGTISVMYELSNVGDDLAINAPQGARVLGLFSILGLLGSLR
jgi:hypothetical protein